MMLLKDYLESKADFYSPQPTSTHSSTSGISDAEVIQLLPEWHPVAAYSDSRMVDSLIESLNNCIGDAAVPESLKAFFEMKRVQDPQSWIRNDEEPDASNMVISGALYLASHCSTVLGYPFAILPQCRATNFASKVNFLYRDAENKKVVVEVQSPGAFSIAESVYFSGIRAFPLNLMEHRPNVARNVLNKLCLCMAAHQTEWGALTCHDRWIFIRLHKASDVRPAYITFSTVEGQTSNTRPFRALMGMILATKRDLDVESHADSTIQLTAIEVRTEEELQGVPSPQSPVNQEDKDYDPRSSEESSKGERSRPLELRPDPRILSTPPDILLGWSEDVTPSNKWLSLYSVDGAEGCPSIGCKPVRLRLQRVIGTGSTACIYEAKVDSLGQHHQLYAVKMVKKGCSDEARGHLAGLYQEFKVYCTIERARSDGRPNHVTPRCFGLYETDFTVSLVLEYMGESLPGLEWRGLSRVEKLRLFTAIWELHAIGIRHENLAPRNVVRSPDGTFRIINFARSTLHQCQGLRSVGLSSLPADNKNKEPGCEELGSIWRLLGKPGLSQGPSKPARPLKTNAKKASRCNKSPLASC